MMSLGSTAKSVWWLIRKDFTQELRALVVWPKTLLFGLVLVLLLSLQIDLPAEQRASLVAGLLWITILFTGMLVFERSFACEHDSGCWQLLQLCPITPGAVFLAKMFVNLAFILVLESIIIPLFIVLADVPQLARPVPMAPIVALGSIGFTAIGTLIGALTAGLRHRGGLVALLLLPLVAPVLLSATEATRIVLQSSYDPVWRWWIQLLTVFAVVFTVLGALTFEYVMED
jgi:heme exporter protein B